VPVPILVIFTSLEALVVLTKVGGKVSDVTLRPTIGWVPVPVRLKTPRGVTWSYAKIVTVPDLMPKDVVWNTTLKVQKDISGLRAA